MMLSYIGVFLSFTGLLIERDKGTKLDRWQYGQIITSSPYKDAILLGHLTSFLVGDVSP